MATNSRSNRVTQQVSDQALIDGLNKHAATLASFSVGGENIKAPDVITSLKADIAAANAVAPAKAAWQVTVQAATSQRAQTGALVAKVKQALLVTFAGQVDALADFGLTPRKARAPLTSEQKAAAAAKARATRAARNTLGTQQKKAVKGNVTGVTVTPVVRAPVAATPPATASPASPTPATRTS
jgi:hypothetical protein